MNIINIVCVLKSAGPNSIYTEEWVEKLFNSINRNTTYEVNFYCLTDMNTKVGIKIPFSDNVGPGWWAKLELFSIKEFVNIPTLYFDLDTVICGNIDQIIKDCISQKNFLMNKGIKGPSSCLMYWNGDYRYLYEDFIKDQDNIIKNYGKSKGPKLGDQGFIQDNVPFHFIQSVSHSKFFSYIHRIKNNYKHVRILMFAKRLHKPHTSDHILITDNWK
jgi:hypothetical protein